jgi:hypothetical protein
MGVEQVTAAFLAALAAAVVSTVFGNSAAPAVVSTNWAGYAVTTPKASAQGFTAVSATWTVPAVACGRAAAGTGSATWVGLGGFATGSGTLAQIGTSSDCSRRGGPVYSAWREVLPSASDTLDLDVRPGDTITASVVRTSTQARMSLENARTGASAVSTHRIPATPNRSAEWIVEAPSWCGAVSCRVMPLARFRSVTFTEVEATAAGHTGALLDPGWEPTAIELVPGTHHELFPAGHTMQNSSSRSGSGIVPGSVVGEGRSFTLWWRARPLAPTFSS